MPPAGDLAYALGLPPAEAIRFFQSKGHALTWDWREMAGEDHAKTFTVAKALRVDILKDIQQAVGKMIAEGQTERMAAKDLIPLLQAKGWWGKQLAADPRGDLQLVQLGSPRRLETIFRTNLQTAYMTGRYRQMTENAAARPYWMYVAVMDKRTRPAHAALHGRVFRWDDPVWRVIYPPNGFRCRCRVRALSESYVKRHGIVVHDSRDFVYPVERADEPPTLGVKLPGMDRGFAPDPGWDYNPGQAWARWDRGGLLEDCVGGGATFAEGGKTGRCIKALSGQKTWRDYNRPDLRRVGDEMRLPAPPILQAGKTAAEALMVLQTALGVGEDRPMRVIQTPVDPVAIRAEWLAHLVEKRDQARERFANFITPTLEKPFEVWLTAYDDGWRKRYLGLFKEQRDLLMVVRENQDGSLLWNVIRMRDEELNKQRAGSLIWKKE
ncbi:MAG: minor capsid protein [Magnetococcales bacterium]|nr:minor capsid protein [Magnetococcales bacterium]